MKRAAGFVIFRQLCGKIEYLLLRASYGDYHWSAPKGYVDEGEDDFATALRETFEEVGFLKDDLIIHTDYKKTLNYKIKDKPKEVVYWLAELRNPNKKPKLSEEHTEMKWMELEAAKEIVKFRDNQKMLDEFHDIILSLNKKSIIN